MINKDQFFEKMNEQELVEERQRQQEEKNALQGQFRALVKSSREHIMDGDFNVALDEAKRALKINPSSALAAHPHSLIAEVYLKQNKLDEAITEINEALKYNEQYWYANVVCAKIYYAGKDFEQMVNHYYKALNSVKEKELVSDSFSDITDIDEIIADVEKKEYEEYEDDY